MRSILISATLLLSACGTTNFTPTEFPLRDGLIAPMVVHGQTRILNNQPKFDPVIVYSYGGTKLSSDLRAITEAMVKQTSKELSKAAQPSPGNPKTIELKVNSLLSDYVFFHWKSNIQFDAKLGNGEIISLSVRHASGFVEQDLNGCIAEGVMTLLNDQRVRQYLAQ